MPGQHGSVGGRGLILLFRRVTKRPLARVWAREDGPLHGFRCFHPLRSCGTGPGTLCR